jgi:hypothetical protein
MATCSRAWRHFAALELGCDVLLALVTDHVTSAEAAATTIKASTAKPMRLLVVTIATVRPFSDVHLCRSLCVSRKLYGGSILIPMGRHVPDERVFNDIPNQNRRTDATDPQPRTGGFRTLVDQRSVLYVTSRRGVIAILASGFLLSACGAGEAATAQSSATPTQDAIAWFNAINSNNVRAAHKLFEPKQVDQISWMNQPAADQSKFTDVHCRTTVITNKRAAVLCAFAESASPTEGQPVTSWSISFQRTSTNGWLINNYGQG